MLATHHRPDIYDSHASDVDPQDICHYALDEGATMIPIFDPTDNRITVPADLPSPKEMSLNRAKAALALIEPTGSDAGDFRALMIDLWELARIKGVDLQAAVETAKAVLTYTDIAAGTHRQTP